MGANELAKEEGAKGPVSALAKEARWDDAVLVSRALLGDSFAENAIYRQHAPYLLNLAARLTRRISDADDVVQETFLVAFKKLDKLADPKALRSWLIRSLISQVNRSFRIRRLRAFFGMDHGREDATLLILAVHDARPDLRAELKEVDAVLGAEPIGMANDLDAPPCRGHEHP
jgi:RNA polymerase sigma-70 factor (ECF subfamily)